MNTTAKVAIETCNLKKNFREIEVLRGISLKAIEGEVVSILGSSGSGKSTFLRCINMLEIPNSGSVQIYGEIIKTKMDKTGTPIISDKAQIRRIRAQLCMVFQQFNLWSHMTALENVMEAPIQVLKLSKQESKERAEALLEKVGVFHRKDSYPLQLSGGQQQRVAIARALAMEPKALLFDEPTSALDPELVGEVLQVILKLAEEGTTMLLVTHEMGFAKDVANKTIFLHNGLIEEEGLSKEIFNHPTSSRFRQFLQGNVNL